MLRGILLFVLLVSACMPVHNKNLSSELKQTQTPDAANIERFRGGPLFTKLDFPDGAVAAQSQANTTQCFASYLPPEPLGAATTSSVLGNPVSTIFVPIVSSGPMCVDIPIPGTDTVGAKTPDPSQAYDIVVPLFKVSAGGQQDFSQVAIQSSQVAGATTVTIDPIVGNYHNNIIGMNFPQVLSESDGLYYHRNTNPLMGYQDLIVAGGLNVPENGYSEQETRDILGGLGLTQYMEDVMDGGMGIWVPSDLTFRESTGYSAKSARACANNEDFVRVLPMDIKTYVDIFTMTTHVMVGVAFVLDYDENASRFRKNIQTTECMGPYRYIDFSIVNAYPAFEYWRGKIDQKRDYFMKGYTFKPQVVFAHQNGDQTTQAMYVVSVAVSGVGIVALYFFAPPAAVGATAAWVGAVMFKNADQNIFERSPLDGPNSGSAP